ncbi:unnamed protein product [Onchocerca ochengi]|uniref:Uncharacterized protein n=1 Tax=Onchocerca ochengi TaxID=42157 RepID=A0A182EMQ4_ONCOC|nr:unnamed protein product [Onchocerca ochengi]
MPQKRATERHAVRREDARLRGQLCSTASGLLCSVQNEDDKMKVTERSQRERRSASNRTPCSAITRLQLPCIPKGYICRINGFADPITI